jgi:hypothetical protein
MKPSLLPPAPEGRGALGGRACYGAVAALLLLATAGGAAEKSPPAPVYPGQPSINAAVKQLTEAQTKAPNDQAEALSHLRKALRSLEAAIKDKGSFRATSIRLTKQAIRHLEKGESDTALHEIEEALENANRAGKAGSN